jgi:hypothetical protein
MKLRLCLLLTVLAGGLLRAADPSPVAIAVSKDHVDFKSGDVVVARYHIAESVAKPYFWPLLGPGGVRVTRAWPMEPGQPGETRDHPHQKSVWFCHGDVIPEGVELKHKVKGVEGVDFWAEGKGHGKIVCVKVEPPTTGANHGRVTTHNEWRTADGVKVLDETRTITLYDFGDTRLFVFDIDLSANDAPVVFGDTKEGSFGLRINDQITEKSGHGKLENAEGKVGEKAIWGYVSAWCDYSGPLDGKTVGLAILADPSNPVPSAWHSRGYGLMAANPFGRAKAEFPAMKGKHDLVKLGKGEHLKLRYGLLIHPGDAKEGKVAEYYGRFVKLKG